MTILDFENNLKLNSQTLSYIHSSLRLVIGNHKADSHRHGSLHRHSTTEI